MRPSRYRWLDCCWIVGLVVVVWGFDLFGHPLSVPDSGRYAEIPREMLESGDWVTPHLNGVKYFEKPPLFYWLQLLAFKVAGVGADVAMVPNFVLSVAIVVVTYLLGDALFGRKSGVASALALASSLGGFVFTRVLTLDVILSCMLTVSIGSFWLAYLRREQGGVTYLWVAYIAAAGAVMSKGLVGLLFPMLILGSWILLTRDWRGLRYWMYWPAISVAMLLVLPWHLLMQQCHPEFWQFYFVEQHFARFFTDYAMRQQGWWFFGVVLLVGWYPWVVMFSAILRNLLKRWRYRWEQFKLSCWDVVAKSELFIAMWAVVIVLFFSCSQSKLIPYILPAFPPIALLVGNYLANLWEKPMGRSNPVNGWIWLHIILIVGILAILIWFPDIVRIDGGVSLLRKLVGVWVCTLCVIWWLRRYSTSNSYILMTIGLSMVAFFQIISGYVYNINGHSIYSLVQILQQELTDQDTVIIYHDYYQELPFYLRRKVVIVGDGGELAPGVRHQPEAKGWIWQQHRFEKCMLLADNCRSEQDATACQWLVNSGCLLKGDWSQDREYGYYYILTKWLDWENLKEQLPIVLGWRLVARDRDVVLITDKPGG